MVIFRYKISLLVFVLEFCGFANCLDRGKCRKLLYAAQSNLGNCSVYRLVWMRPFHFFLRHEIVLGIGHLVVFLFH